jgi:hypothetical protein
VSGQSISSQSPRGKPGAGVCRYAPNQVHDNYSPPRNPPHLGQHPFGVGRVEVVQRKTARDQIKRTGRARQSPSIALDESDSSISGVSVGLSQDLGTDVQRHDVELDPYPRRRIVCHKRNVCGACRDVEQTRPRRAWERVTDVSQGDRRAAQPSIQETDISQIRCEVGENLLRVIEQLTSLSASRYGEEGGDEKVLRCVSYLYPIGSDRATRASGLYRAF